MFEPHHSPQVCPVPRSSQNLESTSGKTFEMQKPTSSHPTRYFELQHPQPLELPPTFTSGRLGKQEIVRGIAGGDVTRLRRGVYSMSQRELNHEREDHYAQQASDHLLAVSAARWSMAHHDALSHTSAALLWGLSGFAIPTRVMCTSPVRNAPNLVGITRVRTLLPSDQVQVVSGIRVTSLERTVVDSVRSIPLSQGIALADCAIRHGMDRATALRINSEKSDPRFRAKAEAILRLAQGSSDSPPESFLRLIALHAGVPNLVPQLRVEAHRRIYYPDLADPTIRLALEYDGKPKYDQRDALYREKLREDALRGAGWTVLRFSAQDLRDPFRTIARIQEALRSLGASTASRLPMPLHPYIGS